MNWNRVWRNRNRRNKILKKVMKKSTFQMIFRVLRVDKLLMVIQKKNSRNMHKVDSILLLSKAYNKFRITFFKDSKYCNNKKNKIILIIITIILQKNLTSPLFLSNYSNNNNSNNSNHNQMINYKYNKNNNSNEF